VQSRTVFSKDQLQCEHNRQKSAVSSWFLNRYIGKCCFSIGSLVSVRGSWVLKWEGGMYFPGHFDGEG
jgi:hypothetical protein